MDFFCPVGELLCHQKLPSFSLQVCPPPSSQGGWAHPQDHCVPALCSWAPICPLFPVLPVPWGTIQAQSPPPSLPHPPSSQILCLIAWALQTHTWYHPPQGPLMWNPHSTPGTLQAKSYLLHHPPNAWPRATLKATTGHIKQLTSKTCEQSPLGPWHMDGELLAWVWGAHPGTQDTKRHPPPLKAPLALVTER